MLYIQHFPLFSDIYALKKMLGHYVTEHTYSADGFNADCWVDHLTHTLSENS